MTDKEQIIINGIDVSECDHFREGYCHPGTGVCYKCDTNCQYAAFYLKEQLARKTQECEKLTNKNNLLTAELNKTKLLLEGKNTQYNTLLEEIENYKINTKTLRLGTNTLASERDRYRKALEEIEGYAKNSIKMPLERRLILDIINKAKNEVK